MNTDVLFSSNKEDWETPQDFFDELNKEFDFNVDVCADKTNYKCPYFLDKETDALEWTWTYCHLASEGKLGDGTPVRTWIGLASRAWCNPPYNRSTGKWVAKAVEEVNKGNAKVVVMLLPARTDTKYFHQYIWDNEKHRPRPGVEVRFIKGRLKFGGAKNSAPFPSMVVIFRKG